MTTVLLFAELLIIGLQVCVWFFLLTLIVFDVNWIQALLSTRLSDWAVIIVAILVSIFYALGIIFDRLADLVFSGWEKRLRKNMTPDHPLHTTKMKTVLYEKYQKYKRIDSVTLSKKY